MQEFEAITCGIVKVQTEVILTKKFWNVDPNILLKSLDFCHSLLWKKGKKIYRAYTGVQCKGATCEFTALPTNPLGHLKIRQNRGPNPRLVALESFRPIHWAMLNFRNSRVCQQRGWSGYHELRFDFWTMGKHGTIRIIKTVNLNNSQNWISLMWVLVILRKKSLH